MQMSKGCAKSEISLPKSAPAVIGCRASVPDADLYPITNTMRNTSLETTQEQDEALARRNRLSTIHYSRSAGSKLRKVSRARVLPLQNARVVEWQTRTFEGRMPKGMRVQVPPRARYQPPSVAAATYGVPRKSEVAIQRSAFSEFRGADSTSLGLSADRSLLPTFLFS